MKTGQHRDLNLTQNSAEINLLWFCSTSKYEPTILRSISHKPSVKHSAI